MKLAFLYPTYDRGSCQHHFAGVYDDEEEARDCLYGDPYGHKHLELIDTETYEFTRFEWRSDYKVEYIDKYDYDKSDLKNYDNKIRLTNRWNEDDVIETRYHEIHNRKDGKAYALYRSGKWKKQ